MVERLVILCEIRLEELRDRVGWLEVMGLRFWFWCVGDGIWRCCRGGLVRFFGEREDRREWSRVGG